MASERASLLRESSVGDSLSQRSTDNSFSKLSGGVGDQGDGPQLPMPVTMESHLLDKGVNRRRKISIVITYITMFISSITFSIVLSSLWPFLLQVDPSATASFLGYVVAAYSLGQLVASPLFGVWSNYRPVREPLIVSTVINVIANVVYSYADAFPADKKWALLVSRAFVGFGAGNVAVARAYVSGATTEKERTGAMAGLSGCQAIGFVLGPGLGLVFQPLGPTGVHWDAIKLELNLYTGPGFLSALFGVVNLILLIVLFREYRIYTKVKQVTCMTCYRCCVKCCSKGYASHQQEDKESEDNKDSEDSVESEDSDSEDEEILHSLNKNRLPKLSFWQRISSQFDLVAVLVSMFLFFIVLFVFAVVETLISPLSLDEFGWSKAESTLYNNILFVCSAFVAIATFVAVKFISKVADERNIFMVGFFLVAFGLYIVMPFPGRSMPIQLELLSGPPVDQNGSFAFAPFNVSNVTHHFNGGGCDVSKQPWCLYVPAINLWQFLTGFALVSIGYPIGNVMSYSIFSKILGSKPQGTMMGWLTAAGSLARTVGPLFVSTVYDNFGAQVLFAVCIGILAVAILTLLVSYRKLVPNTRDANRLSLT